MIWILGEELKEVKYDIRSLSCIICAGEGSVSNSLFMRDKIVRVAEEVLKYLLVCEWNQNILLMSQGKALRRVNHLNAQKVTKITNFYHCKLLKKKVYKFWNIA